ncbi:MAG: hypothetical protein H7308_03215 [Chthonomonadaceae bacterium]|nr:hypothetical protein [Chthonomonadaceae bacterium]
MKKVSLPTIIIALILVIGIGAYIMFQMSEPPVGGAPMGPGGGGGGGKSAAPSPDNKKGNKKPITP